MLTPMPPLPPETAATSQAVTPAAASTPQAQLTQFLTLLTTQIQNQDPLEPMDSTGFVEQLATFSTLEQQVQSNETLSAILEVLRG